MKHPQGKYHTIFQLICMLALAFLGFGCGKTYNGESAEYYKKALAWEVVSLQRARQELKKHQAATCIDVSVIQSGVTPIDSNGSGYIYIYIDCDVENKSDLHITGFRYTATLLQHGVTIQHEREATVLMGDSLSL